MKPLPHFNLRTALAAILTALPSAACAGQPTASAVAAFNSYTAAVEARLARQHLAGAALVAAPSSGLPELRRGGVLVENLTPFHLELAGASLYDWRGTAFVPGATTADFDRLMRDFAAYPHIYAPQVRSATVLSHSGDRYQTTLRVSQKHVLTVVLDTTYDIDFGRGWSISRSTQINEIANPGTAGEHALSPAKQHGFLWRLNTYWTTEERDGGLYLQIESVSLTRSIPTGLGWALSPYVDSVPRQSLEFTLHATCAALAAEHAAKPATPNPSGEAQ